MDVVEDGFLFDLHLLGHVLHPWGKKISNFYFMQVEGDI
jgi:hypothetical protein